MAYEIVYWPGFTGRAEPAILLLEDVGEPYTIDTDVQARIEALGQTEPVFACPLLIDGETVVSQTSVIVEYLAGKHGCDVAPADAIGAAQFGYNLADIWREIYEGRRDGSADFLTDRFPRWLDVIEHSFGGDQAWFFSDDAPTWVDYLVLNIVTLATYCWGEPAVQMMRRRSKFNAWTERMMERPRLKAYFENEASLPVAYVEVRATASS